MFEKYLEERAAWSIETFGPLDHQRDTRAAAILDHIRKELIEIERSPHDLEEWIDVISLALDGALRCAGAASTEILPALVAKLEKCKARTWPDWRTHPPGNAVEHVRAPHRAQRVTAADLAAVRAQELADFSPSATAISSPIEVRELPTLGNSQPRHADWIKNLPNAAAVEREDVGGRMRGSCGILDEHHTIDEMSNTIEKLTSDVEMLTRTIGDYKIREEIVRECYDMVFAARLVNDLPRSPKDAAMLLRDWIRRFSKTPTVGDHVHAKTSSDYILIGTVTTIERSAIGVVYQIHPDGSSASSPPMCAQQVALVDVESGPTWQQTAENLREALALTTAERDAARETLQQIRDLLTVENDGPEGPMPSSWFLGQIRQILGIGISAEHDAETLDLSGGES